MAGRGNDGEVFGGVFLREWWWGGRLAWLRRVGPEG